MFLVSVMVHQHLGAACVKVDSNISESKILIEEMKALIQESRELNKAVKEKIGET
jgi:hypothetical protein